MTSAFIARQEGLGTRFEAITGAERAIASAFAERAALVDEARRFSEATAASQGIPGGRWPAELVAEREFVSELAVTLRLPQRTTARSAPAARQARSPVRLDHRAGYHRRVHMLWRTLLHSLLSRFGRRLGHYEVARTRFITLPTDQDILRHMNNGVYLSIMDIARFDMLHRTGIWAIFLARGWYPVVVSETISFRKSLTLGQRFTVESRILGFDDKAVYVEQRFVRPDADGEPEVYAQGFIRGRFLKRSGGVVTIDELTDAVGAVPEGVTVPHWLLEWSTDVQMPATRAAAPSIWE